MNQPGENDKIILDPILACFTQMWTPIFLFVFVSSFSSTSS